MEAAVYEQIEHNAAGSILKAPAQVESCCFVIDDDAGICKALCFTLRKLGFATREIATPAALDRELAERSPVLVFLDLGLGEHGALVGPVGEPLRAAVESVLPRFVMEAFAPGPRVALSALREDAIPVGALLLAASGLNQSR